MIRGVRRLVVCAAVMACMLAACSESGPSGTAGAGSGSEGSDASTGTTDVPSSALADARVCQTFSNAEGGFHQDYVLPDGTVRSVAGYEGWWNSNAGDASGALLEPSEWPEPERSHLRVALILAGTGDVLASYDRTTCAGVSEIADTDLGDLAPGAIAVIDADTGEILETFGP